MGNKEQSLNLSHSTNPEKVRERKLADRNVNEPRCSLVNPQIGGDDLFETWGNLIIILKENRNTKNGSTRGSRGGMLRKNTKGTCETRQEVWRESEKFVVAL